MCQTFPAGGEWFGEQHARSTMSRRKQSNPKSIKRKSEDELDEIARIHHLPRDILQLKQTDEQTNTEYGVYTSRPLGPDTVLGDYKGRGLHVHPDETHLYPCLIELPATTSWDGTTHVLVDELSGLWLKLLHLTADSAQSNICLLIKDEGQITCTVTKEIGEDTQLVAMLTRDLDLDLAASPAAASPLHLHDKGLVDSALPAGSLLPARYTSLYTGHPRTPSSDSGDKPKTPPPNHALIHECAFCGMRFSSETTLQAHESIYCTKRPLHLMTYPHDPTALFNSRRNVSNIQENFRVKRKFKEEAHSSPVPTKIARVSSRTDSDNDSNRESATKHTEDKKGDRRRDCLPELAGCPHCTYTSDSGDEMERHLKMHFPEEIHVAARPDSADGKTPSKTTPQIPDLYCNECEIQFTSLNTYSGHKEFYCQQRRRNTNRKDGERMSSPRRSSPGRASPKSRSPTSLPQAAQSGANPSMFLTSPTALSTRIPPSMLAHQGMGLNHAMLMSSPFMAAAYNSMPLFMPPMIQGLTNPVQAHQPVPNLADIPKTKSTSNTEDKSEQPLDLTVKKKETVQTIKSEPSPVKVITIEPRPDSAKVTENEFPIKQSPGVSPKSPRVPVIPPGVDVPLPLAPPEGLLPPLAPISMLHPQHAALLLAQQQQQAPQANISKCMDCNIVFYKHENFLAHKEHYCASRRGRSQSSTECSIGKSPNSAPSPASPRGGVMDRLQRSPAGSISPASLTPSPAKIRTPDSEVPTYCCKECKIKFSSPDTLKAHQCFYCPARSQDGNGRSPRNGERSPDVPDSLSLSCRQCGNSFGSARLLKLHYCTGTTMRIPLFHCPYCDYIAQSDSRLVEHIKAHAPSKAYKCALCGYRGNTVRGMRMHGKMHVDNAENFTDDHMIELEEPPLIPKRHRSDSASVDWEGELLRLKCEPYKRRRSRKGHEKSEHMATSSSHACVECNEILCDATNHTCPVQRNLSKIDNEVRCKSCDYVAEGLGDLSRHQRRRHDSGDFETTCDEVSYQEPPKQPSPSNRSLTPEQKSDTENNNNNVDDSVNEIDMKPEINLARSSPKADERENSGPIPAKTLNSVSPSQQRPTNQYNIDSILSKPSTDKSIARHCKQCDITFTYLSTFVAHKKYYCNSHSNERHASVAQV